MRGGEVRKKRRDAGGKTPRAVVGGDKHDWGGHMEKPNRSASCRRGVELFGEKTILQGKNCVRQGIKRSTAKCTQVKRVPIPFALGGIFSGVKSPL